MVFSSHIFIFYFLPLALILYFAAPRRFRNLLLVLVSYVFYGWANAAFVLVLLLSTVIDYLVGIALVAGCPSDIPGQLPQLEPGTPRTRGQRIMIIVSIAANLSLLGFFKYFNFFIDNVSAALQAMGLSDALVGGMIRVTLPLGISFYTFQSMSYTIDVYRGYARPLRNFIDFACFVSMFPQLVAGPIIRFKEVSEQLVNRVVTLPGFSRGIAFLTVGLAKKVLLANPCGKVADTVFGASSSTCIDAWYGAVAYAFQIYFDFSAYSDMAVGLGLMMGFVFAKNFDSPYSSKSITEFWRRWHISLSTWLKDYLYIPLGGNRISPLRTYFNLMAVMLIGGFWHGAAWNFIAWGAMHGTLLCAERLHGKQGFLSNLPDFMKITGTFVMVLITWVFFRADSLSSALEYLGRMFLGAGAGSADGIVTALIYRPYYLIAMIAGAWATWRGACSWEWTRVLTFRKTVAVIVLFVISLIVLTTQEYNPFIYFIF